MLKPLAALARPPLLIYFPAIVCGEHHSPIDALVALCVPRDEAMDLVAASWGHSGSHSGSDCLVATLAGGRPVAVLPTPEGRWAACNAFFSELYATPEEAERRLGRLLKDGRRGYVAGLPAWAAKAAVTRL